MRPLPNNASKVTILLYDADIEILRRRYGRGWTEQVRLMVQKNCKDWKKHKRTLEELMKEQADV